MVLLLFESVSFRLAPLSSVGTLLLVELVLLDLAGFAKLVPRTGTGGGPGAVFLLPALADAAAGCFAAETAFAETDDFVVEADPGSACRYAPGESFFLEEAGGTGRVELLLLFLLFAFAGRF